MSYWTDLLALTPACLWKLDEAGGATVAADATGNSRTGTYNNFGNDTPPAGIGAAASITPAQPGSYCPYCDGTQDYVSRAHEAWMVGAESFTAAIAMVETDRATARELMGKLNRWQVWEPSGGRLIFYCQVGSTWTPCQLDLADAIAEGSAYLVVVRRDSVAGKMSIWLNGLKKKEVNHVGTLVTGGELTVGRSSAAPKYHKGPAQGFAYWPTTALSDAQILALYTSWATAGNLPPTQPGEFTVPAAGASYDSLIGLDHGPSSDPESQPLQYEYDYWNGATWAAIRGLGALGVAWNTQALPDGAAYKVRVRAHDGENYSTYRESGVFTIYHVPPGQPGAFTNPAGGSLHGQQTLACGAAVDPSGFLPLTYRFELSTDGGATFPVLVADGRLTPDCAFDCFAYPPAPGYMVRCRATNSHGTTGPWRDSPAFSIANGTPSAPSITTPAGGSTYDAAVPIVLVPATDPDVDPLAYEYEYQVDGGAWNPLATNQPATYEWDTSTLPWSHGYKVRARACDPQLQGPWVESAAFSIVHPSQAPTVAAFRAFPSDYEVTLVAGAYGDPDGGAQSAAAWELDVEGGDWSNPIFRSESRTELVRNRITGLTPNTLYQARMAPIDGGGQQGPWHVVHFSTFRYWINPWLADGHPAVDDSGHDRGGLHGNVSTQPYVGLDFTGTNGPELKQPSMLPATAEDPDEPGFSALYGSGIRGEWLANGQATVQDGIDLGVFGPQITSFFVIMRRAPAADSHPIYAGERMILRSWLGNMMVKDAGGGVAKLYLATKRPVSADPLPPNYVAAGALTWATFPLDETARLVGWCYDQSHGFTGMGEEDPTRPLAWVWNGDGPTPVGTLPPLAPVLFSGTWYHPYVDDDAPAGQILLCTYDTGSGWPRYCGWLQEFFMLPYRPTVEQMRPLYELMQGVRRGSFKAAVKALNPSLYWRLGDSKPPLRPPLRRVV